MFHALTGCETIVSRRACYNDYLENLAVLPEITDALLNLSSSPSDIHLHTNRSFVILLFNTTSTCTDIDKARNKISTTKNNVHLIAPTKTILEENGKRADIRGARH